MKKIALVLLSFFAFSSVHAIGIENTGSGTTGFQEPSQPSNPAYNGNDTTNGTDGNNGGDGTETNSTNSGSGTTDMGPER